MRTRHGKFCEFCQGSLKPNSEDTVCDTCDAQMELDQSHELRLQKQAWAEKYSCRSCHVGLPQTRTRYCEVCLPTNNIESEGEFDGITPIDFEDDSQLLNQRQHGRVCGGPCGQYKEASQFYILKKKGKLTQYCLSCMKDRNRKYWEIRKNKKRKAEMLNA